MAELLVVHPHFHPRRSGASRHVEAIVAALTPRFDARTISVGAPIDPALRRGSVIELLTEAARGHNVVWHAHRNIELLVGLLLRALAPGVKVVFTRHSSGRASWFTRLLAARADLRVALTEQVRSGLALPASIVPHGVDLRTFAPPVDRDASFAALGLGGALGVGVVGRIRPDKGQGDFAAAVGPLLEEDDQLRAILVGRALPKDRAFLDDLRRRAGPRLHAVGEQPDPERWYRGLTICVQPSHAEAFSMALLEAMACGCCVVAARLPNMELVIEDGVTGFLYPPGDVGALAHALRRLCKNPAEARAVGARAASAVRERFSISREADALAALYVPLFR